MSLSFLKIPVGMNFFPKKSQKSRINLSNWFSDIYEIYTKRSKLAMKKNMVRVKKSIDRFFHADHVFENGEAIKKHKQII